MIQIITSGGHVDKVTRNRKKESTVGETSCKTTDEANRKKEGSFETSKSRRMTIMMTIMMMMKMVIMIMTMMIKITTRIIRTALIQITKMEKSFKMAITLMAFTSLPLSAEGYLTVLSTNKTYPHRIASYGPILDDNGIDATLVTLKVMDPPNTFGCLVSNTSALEGHPWIALVQQGQCSYLTKTLNAQKMGAVALIVGSDNPYMGLITMDANGNSTGVTIPSVYVSFYDYIELDKQSLNQFPTYPSFMVNLAKYEIKFWPVLNIIIARILAPALIMIFLYTIAFKCRESNKKKKMKEKAELVANLPKRKYEKTSESQGDEGECCAICLEEYKQDDELRILPCKHEFHVQCIDTWLLERKKFCPLCKVDAFPNEESSLV